MYTIVQWSSVSIDKNMKLDQSQLIHASRSHFICKKRKLALVVQQSLLTISKNYKVSILLLRLYHQVIKYFCLNFEFILIDNTQTYHYYTTTHSRWNLVETLKLWWWRCINFSKLEKSSTIVKRLCCSAAAVDGYNFLFLRKMTYSPQCLNRPPLL